MLLFTIWTQGLRPTLPYQTLLDIFLNGIGFMHHLCKTYLYFPGTIILWIPWRPLIIFIWYYSWKYPPNWGQIIWVGQVETYWHFILQSGTHPPMSYTFAIGSILLFLILFILESAPPFWSCYMQKVLRSELRLPNSQLTRLSSFN